MGEKKLISKIRKEATTIVLDFGVAEYLLIIITVRRFMTAEAIFGRASSNIV